MPITFLNQFMACKLVYPQSIALPHHLCQLRKLIGHFLGHFHLALQIVIILLETLHLLHVPGIIGVIIVDIHGGELVETFYEHALTVGVDKSQRPGNLIHALCPAPVLNGLQQCLAHLNIVDEVKPSEAHLMAVPPFVGPAVDDGCHTTYDLPVL